MRSFRVRVGVGVLLLGGLVLVTAGRSGSAQVAAPATPALRLTAELIDGYQEARAHGWRFLPGQAIVRFRAGTTQMRRARALSALRGQPAVGSLEWIGDSAVVRDPTERDARLLVERLLDQPEVESAEPNYLRRLPATRFPGIAIENSAARPAGTPNDELYSRLQWNFNLLDMPSAWNINDGGSASVIVGVIDTGITTQQQTLTLPLFTGVSIQQVPMLFDVNPDLPATRLVSPRDFIFFNAGSPVVDMTGHGSHVSATIAEETNNALRLAGMAYRTKILPVKVCVGYWELMIANAQLNRPGFLVPPDEEGFCTESAISQGIRYAVDNGAKVINVSLGGSDASTLERDAIAYAVQNGAFVSISAGNDFEDGNPTNYPASYAATIDGAMSVGAIGKSETRAHYSSTGTWVEIAAPGGDDRTPGSGEDSGVIWQSTLRFTDQDPSVIIPRFDRYNAIGYQGTSMAAPHVSALAALLRSQGVTDPKAIEAIIRATAKDLGDKGKDPSFGYGLIQPRAALFGRGFIR